MNFVSDLKELSAWIIGISSLVVLLAFVYYRVKSDKVKT